MNFELPFTDKEITPWGGLALLKRMLDHLGFDAALAASPLPQPGSNRGYRPEQQPGSKKIQRISARRRSVQPTVLNRFADVGAGYVVFSSKIGDGAR